MEIFLTADAWITLGTLAALEIVLGIDNLVFLSIMAGKLPPAQRPLGRRLGLGLALGTRLALLAALNWAMHLESEIALGFSGRDLILLFGGLFLLAKSTHEIFSKVEAEDQSPETRTGTASFASVLVQIAVIDLVFSLDSVVTAVGMANDLIIMVIAMVIAVAVMIIFANKVGDFVERHPSMKILALSFLILIGAMLVSEGFGEHINKGYIYFAMAFSLGVEFINMRVRKKAPVKLHGPLSQRASINPPPPTSAP